MRQAYKVYVSAGLERGFSVPVINEKENERKTKTS